MTSNFSYASVLSYNSGIHIQLPAEIGYVEVFKILIVNSSFFSMSQKVLSIISSGCTTNTNIMIKGCVFKDNIYLQTLAFQPILMKGEPPHIKVMLTFIHCQFFNNCGLILLSVDASLCQNSTNASFALSSKIIITNCSLFNNYLSLMKLHNTNPLLNTEICINRRVLTFGNCNDDESAKEIIRIENFDVRIRGPVYISNNQADFVIISIYCTYKTNVLFDGLIILSNNTADTVMEFYLSYVTFNGPVTVSQNHGVIILAHSSTVILNGPIVISMNDLCKIAMLLQYSDLLLSGSILFESNFCGIIITLVSADRESAYIEVMEYSEVTFRQNRINNLIVVETNYDYYNFYPPCLFQYVTWQIIPVTSPSHYAIIVSSDLSLNDWELFFYNYIKYCKWIPEAEFQDYKPKVINQQVIQFDHKFQHLK